MEGKDFVEELITDVISENLAMGIDSSLEYLKKDGRTFEEAEKKILEAVNFLLGIKAY